MPFNHLILYQTLRPLPSIFPSIRVFSNQSALHIRWPKYRRFSLNISPANEYSGFISFRVNWFDPAVQGTLKNLQFKSINSPSHWFYINDSTFLNCEESSVKTALYSVMKWDLNLKLVGNIFNCLQFILHCPQAGTNFWAKTNKHHAAQVISWQACQWSKTIKGH